MPRTRSHFLDNLEFYLTLLSVALILAVPLALDLRSEFTELAITAVLVGVLHGATLWTIRRRQRRLRRRLVGEIRAMLTQRVHGDLQEILTNTRPPDSDLSDEDRMRLNRVIQAVWRVSAAVEAISVESLFVWQRRPGAGAADGNRGADESGPAR